MSASRRQSLTDLIPAKTVGGVAPVTAPPEPAPEPEPEVAEAAPAPPAPALTAVPEPSPVVVQQPSHIGSEPQPPATRRRATKPSGPKYLQLERKEVRITAGQYDELTALARRLNRQRPRGSGGEDGRRERITENTLIRIAIDLLLGQESQLGGATEDDLRKSVMP